MALIEMLRANGSWEADAAATAIQVRDRRIEKLEAALRALIEANDNSWHPMEINGAEWFTARQALEGKDE